MRRGQARLLVDVLAVDVQRLGHLARADLYGLSHVLARGHHCWAEVRGVDLAAAAVEQLATVVFLELETVVYLVVVGVGEDRLTILLRPLL